MRKLFLHILIITVFLSVSASVYGEDIIFDFEGTTQEWKIPGWSFDQKDHVATDVEVSEEKASSGDSSLKIMCEFPGDVWSAALVDWERHIYLSTHKSI